MARQGYTRSGNRKQLPFTGGENKGAMGKADLYPPRGEVLKVESQVKFNLDKGGAETFDTCIRDRGLNDYD